MITYYDTESEILYCQYEVRCPVHVFVFQCKYEHITPLLAETYYNLIQDHKGNTVKCQVKCINNTCNVIFQLPI